LLFFVLLSKSGQTGLAVLFEKMQKNMKKSANKKARCQKNLEKRRKISRLEGMKNEKNGKGVGVPRPSIFDSISAFRRVGPPCTPPHKQCLWHV
jgi:hypothetical protein